MRHPRSDNREICAVETPIYRKGADVLDNSGLPSEAIVGGYGILGFAAAALLAEQQAKRYTEAAKRESQTAVELRARVAEMATTADPRAVGILPEEIRQVIVVAEPLQV